MFSTCIFCNTDLGKNEAIERFPVGRRLAFDASKGRLWVVCRSCERWNLTPLEERWEAIEECERLFRDTKLRVSTDNVGLARIREGTTLVRVGEPQRPEMAAWRYGDQFGRRRKKYIARTAVGLAAVGGYIIAGPVMGLIGGGGMQVLNLANMLISRRGVAKLRTDEGVVRVTSQQLVKVTLRPVRRGAFELEVPYSRGVIGALTHLDWTQPKLLLRGDEALRTASKLLPYINRAGGSATNVSDAVRLLEEAPDPHDMFARASYADRTGQSVLLRPLFSTAASAAIATLKAPQRLALEMALHESDERRALEGELAVLEDRWKEAEEIAAISDNMFLPASVAETLRKLRRTN